MRLVDYLDKGASLGPDAPCLTMGERSLSYAEVQDCPAGSPGRCARSGVRPGDTVAILSGNDPIAFACVFGIARAGAVWCPVNPRNEADGEPGAARAVRLPGAALPAGVRAAGRQDPRPAAAAHDAGLPRRVRCRATRRSMSGLPARRRRTT